MSMIVQQISRVLSESLFNTRAGAYFDPLYTMAFPNRSLTEHTAQILAILEERSDVLTLRLKPSKQWSGFKSGQHLSLGFTINGRRFNRTFSISSSPDLFQREGIIDVTIQRITSGRVTPWIHDQVDDDTRVLISDAQGNFTNSDQALKLLLVAGGVGITPLKSILEDEIEQGRNITLLYYAKSGEHLFVRQLRALEQDGVQIHLINSDKKGSVSKKQLKKYCPDLSTRSAFICGPAGMIEKTSSILEKLEVPVDRIHHELFALPIPRKELENNTVESSLILASTNRVFEVDNQKTILESLETANIPAKSGCRMGICHQCQCSKKSGVVYNLKTGAYSDSGQEIIQPCITLPMGEVVLNLKK